MKKIFILALLCLVHGCSSKSKEPETPPEVQVTELVEKPASEELKKEPKKPKAAPQKVVKEEKLVKEEVKQSEGPIKIMWARPATLPLYYHLHYGFSSDDITQSVRIPVEEIEALEDRVYGPVFVYKLEGIPAGKSVYIFMRSENEADVSQPSQVLRIDKRTGIGVPVSGQSDFQPSREDTELKQQVIDRLKELKKAE